MPVGTQISRCSGRIYDRNDESDIDITDNEELVYKLYARSNNHPWLSMGDEELLRSAGLILLIMRAEEEVYNETVNEQEPLSQTGFGGLSLVRVYRK